VRYLLEHGGAASLDITCTYKFLDKKFTGTPLEFAQYLRQFYPNRQINNNTEVLIALLSEWIAEKQQ
jgi:hypothetical protein